jgi:hypothetical protein
VFSEKVWARANDYLVEKLEGGENPKDPGAHSSGPQAPPGTPRDPGAAPPAPEPPANTAIVPDQTTADAGPTPPDRAAESGKEG